MAAAVVGWEEAAVAAAVEVAGRSESDKVQVPTGPGPSASYQSFSPELARIEPAGFPRQSFPG